MLAPPPPRPTPCAFSFRRPLSSRTHAGDTHTRIYECYFQVLHKHLCLSLILLYMSRVRVYMYTCCAHVSTAEPAIHSRIRLASSGFASKAYICGSNERQTKMALLPKSAARSSGIFHQRERPRSERRGFMAGCRCNFRRYLRRLFMSRLITI